ncbi:hypothetical protein HMPREF3171_07020 [Corynebacterium sp. HMSC08F01]|nr:hypothetical protein HMPREF3171_07020 [Corynebacterium sp. HMSC08F01]
MRGSKTPGRGSIAGTKDDIVFWAVSKIAYMPAHYRRYALAALAYAAAFAYILLRWDAIPDPVPVHFNVNGDADGFEPKTLLHATFLITIGIAISISMLACVPPKTLARQTVNVPEDKALPYSETAAARVEKLCDATADFMSKTLLAMAVLFALTNVSMMLPDISLPFWLEIALWIAFTVYIVVVAIRMTTAKDGIEPDEAEQQRNHLLRMQGGMGTYKEPNDPMVAAVLPQAPGKISVNTAHAPGKRYLWRVMTSVVAVLVVCLLFVFI